MGIHLHCLCFRIRSHHNGRNDIHGSNIRGSIPLDLRVQPASLPKIPQLCSWVDIRSRMAHRQCQRLFHLVNISGSFGGNILFGLGFYWQTPSTLVMIFFLITTIYYFNTWGAKLLPGIEIVSVVFHMAGFVITIVPLWVLAPKNSASDVFGGIVNGGGWSNAGTSFFVGTITILFSNLGPDAAVHIGRLNECAASCRANDLFSGGSEGCIDCHSMGHGSQLLSQCWYLLPLTRLT